MSTRQNLGFQLLELRRRKAVSNSAPNQPTISAGSLTSSGATLTGSAFSDPDVGDTQAAAQWQVTTAADTGYATPVISTGDDAVHLTSYAATGLSPSTAYIARVRYKDNHGNYSAYSTNASFSTTGGFTAFDAGFNFRLNNTDAGFINVEASGEAVCIGEAYPHTFTMTTTGQSASAGFTTNQVGGGRNRSSSVDRRLMGLIFDGGAGPLIFKVDVVAGATYSVVLAVGDPSNSGTQQATVKDGATTKFTAGPTAIAFGHAIDAHGTDFTDAAWPAGNVAQSVTMSGTVLSVELPAGIPLQHLRVTRTG